MDPDPAALVARQEAFFRSGATRPLAFRRQRLQVLLRVIRARERAILEALQEDLPRSAHEAYAAEIWFLQVEIGHVLRHLRQWTASVPVETTWFLRPARSLVQRVPHGKSLIIGPWNYPFQLVLSPLLGAVAAGCCAVVKPSELAPRTGALLCSLLGEVFMPEHVAVVTGGVEETRRLLDLPFDHVFFTGSEAVGRQVAAAVAPRLVPCTLELGGKNPCVVLDGADLDAVARKVAWGKFFNAGQTCVAPDFLLVPAEHQGALVAALGRAVSGFYGTDPRRSADFGRIVSPRHFERLVGLLETGRVVHGGERDPATRYLAPTILADVGWEDPVMQEEIFGPILPVLTCASVDEVYQRLRDRPPPLALYVFAGDRDSARALVDALPSGTAFINGTFHQVASLHLPFGGVGPSGMGRYRGRYSVEAFTYRRSILAQDLRRERRYTYPPYRVPLGLFRKIIRRLAR